MTCFVSRNYPSVNSIYLEFSDTCSLSWFCCPLFLNPKNTVAYINHNFQVEKCDYRKGSRDFANVITHIRLEVFIKNSVAYALKKDDPTLFDNFDLMERMHERIIQKLENIMDFKINDGTEYLTFGKIRKINLFLSPIVHGEIKEYFVCRSLLESLRILNEIK